MFNNSMYGCFVAKIGFFATNNASSTNKFAKNSRIATKVPTAQQERERTQSSSRSAFMLTNSRSMLSSREWRCFASSLNVLAKANNLFVCRDNCFRSSESVIACSFRCKALASRRASLAFSRICSMVIRLLIAPPDNQIYPA